MFDATVSLITGAIGLGMFLLDIRAPPFLIAFVIGLTFRREVTKARQRTERRKRWMPT